MNDDMSRPVATNDDSKHSLTIEDVARRYESAGHAKTIRTLQRYCVSGHLDCLKAPTRLGDIYLVTPESVVRHLAELDEISAAPYAAANRDLSRQMTPGKLNSNWQHPPQRRSRQVATCRGRLRPTTLGNRRTSLRFSVRQRTTTGRDQPRQSTPTRRVMSRALKARWSSCAGRSLPRTPKSKSSPNAAGRPIF